MEDEKDQSREQIVEISEERLKEAQKFIEEEEGVTRRLSGWRQQVVTWFAVAMSLCCGDNDYDAGASGTSRCHGAFSQLSRLSTYEKDAWLHRLV
jgi:hypothetical protein